jgi:hypothetical protein
MAGTEPIDFDGILSSMYRLGPTEEERRRAASSAMLKMGLGILAANQPSPTPRNTLGVIAAGALPAVDAYQSSVDKQIGDRKSAAMAGLATTKLMGDLRMQKRHDEAFGDIGNMTPDQRKDPKFLYDQALRHSAGGNDKLAGTFLSMANHLDTQANKRDPSQMERALDVIRTYHLKDSMAPGTLTPEEQADLHNAVAIVGQVRTAIDPVTQRMETIQPLTLPEVYRPTLNRYGVKNAKPSDVFPEPGRQWAQADRPSVGEGVAGIQRCEHAAFLARTGLQAELGRLAARPGSAGRDHGRAPAA